MLLVFSLLPVIFCEVNISDALKFYFFYLFVIFIPGSALTEALTDNKGIIERYAYSLFFGLLMLLVEYLLMMLTHLSGFSIFVSVIVSLASVYYLYTKRDGIEINDNGISYIGFMLVLFVLYLFCFTVVSYGNPTPDVMGVTKYNKDYLYWIGNSISLTRKFPPYDFRMVGNNYYYHFFSSILIAQININTGINIPILSFSYSYLVSVLWMVSSAFSLFASVIKKNWLVTAGVLLILFTEGSTVYQAHHLYIYPFGYDYGFACGLLAVMDMIDMELKDDYSLKRMLISCLFIFMCTGLKGPIGLIVLMLHGMEAFLMLFKDFKKGTFRGLTWLFAFVLTYLVFIANPFNKVRTINGLEFLGPVAAFDKNIWAIGILSELIEKGMADNGITRLVALLLFVLRSNKAAMFMFITGGIGLIVSLLMKKEVRRFIPGLLMMGLWGIGLSLITYQDGYSQFYFLMATFPYGVLAGLYFLDRLKYENAVILIILVCVFISSSDIWMFMKDRYYDQISEKLVNRTVTELDGSYPCFMNEDEYAAALWLKDNTDINDYVAVDEFKYDGYRKEEMIGVFSERYVYNDGQYADDIEQNRRRELVKNAVNGNSEAINNLIKKNVKYLVVTLSVNEKPDNSLFELVYENKGYCIYRIIC